MVLTSRWSMVMSMVMGVVFLAASGAGPVRAQPGLSQPAAPLAQRGLTVVGSAAVTGTITALAADASTITLRPASDARTVTALVHTVIRLSSSSSVVEDVHGALRLLRVGDEVRAAGWRLSDGRLLILGVTVLNRVVVVAPRRLLASTPAPSVLAEGVVVEAAAGMLGVVDAQGVRRIALPIAVPVEGGRGRASTIQTNDIVRIEEVRLPGRLAPQIRIIVLFAAAAPLRGVVVAKGTAGTEYMLLREAGLASAPSIAIRVGSGTRFLTDGAPRSFAQLSIGQAVTIFGTPLVVGTLATGIERIGVEASVVIW